jgi:hypothetical protein
VISSRGFTSVPEIHSMSSLASSPAARAERQGTKEKLLIAKDAKKGREGRKKRQALNRTRNDKKSDLNHNFAFLRARASPAFKARSIVLEYPLSSIAFMTAAAMPPGVADSCSKPSRDSVPCRQEMIPSASA